MIRFSRKAMVLSLDHYENCFIEYTMFFRRTDVLNYLFDEQMGVGTVHGAEEGHDLIYRMLKDGCRIVYDPGIRYYHPAKKETGRRNGKYTGLFITAAVWGIYAESTVFTENTGSGR